MDDTDDLPMPPSGATLVLHVVKRPLPAIEPEGEYYDEDGKEYYVEDEEKAGLRANEIQQAEEEEEQVIKEVEETEDGNNQYQEQEEEQVVYEETGEQFEEDSVIYEVYDENQQLESTATAVPLLKTEIEQMQPTHNMQPLKDRSVICSLCNSIFESIIAHVAHQKAEHRAINCHVCKEILYGTDSLAKHMEEKHVDCPRYICALCNSTFACYENLAKHENVHKEEEKKVMYKCRSCQFLAATQNLLRRHVYTAHKRPAGVREYKPYICPLCEKSFRYDFTFDAHMKSHEQGDSWVCEERYVQDGQALMEPDEMETTAATKRLKLEENGDETQVEDASTITSQIPEDLPTDASSIQAMLDKDQLVMTSEKPYRCTKCFETFRWQVSLQVHMRVHEQAEAFEKTTHRILQKSQSGQPQYLMHLPTANSNVNLVNRTVLPFVMNQRVTQQIVTQDTGVYTHPSAAQDQNIVYTYANEGDGNVQQHIQTLGGEQSIQTIPHSQDVLTDGTTVVTAENGEQGVTYAVIDDGQANIAGAEPQFIQTPDGQILQIQHEPKIEPDGQEVAATTPLADVTTVPQPELPLDGTLYSATEAVPFVKTEDGTSSFADEVHRDQQFATDGNVLVTGDQPAEHVIAPPVDPTQHDVAGTSLVLRLQSNAWCSSLCSVLADMQRSKTMCNVTLVGSDRQGVVGHACLVAAASPCLKSLLVTVKRGAHSVLKFDTIPSDLWQLLIEFIYTGKVEVPIARVNEIMVAATHLQIEGLATLCADLLQQYNPMDNIIVQLQIEDWSTHVCGVLHQFWKSGTMCDTVLTTGDGATSETVACILAASSPTFHNILGSMKQGMYNIKTDQITKETWEYLFHFMFSGECEVPMGRELLALYQASEQLNMEVLKSLCADCVNSLGTESATS